MKHFRPSWCGASMISVRVEQGLHVERKATITSPTQIIMVPENSKYITLLRKQKNKRTNEHQRNTIK